MISGEPVLIQNDFRWRHGVSQNSDLHVTRRLIHIPAMQRLSIREEAI